MADQGIILKPKFLLGRDIAAGDLVPLMPDYKAMQLGIYAVYPTRKYVAPKVRALIKFLEERFSEMSDIKLWWIFDAAGEAKPRLKELQKVARERKTPSPH